MSSLSTSEHTVRSQEHRDVKYVLSMNQFTKNRSIDADRKLHLSSFGLIFETPEGDLTKPETEWTFVRQTTLRQSELPPNFSITVSVSDLGDYQCNYADKDKLDPLLYTPFAYEIQPVTYSYNQLYRVDYRSYTSNDFSMNRFFEYTFYGVNEYKTIYNCIKSSTQKVYLLDSGCLVVINQAGETIKRYGRFNNTCCTAKDNAVVSGQVQISDINNEFYLSSNGVYLFQHDKDKKRFRTYVVSFNTTNFLTNCLQSDIDFDSCKAVYQSYCRAFRTSTDVGAWMDPRCACVMTDETTQLLINQKTAVTESDQMIVQYAPCLLNKCNDHAFREEKTMAWKLREDAQCPTSLKVCQTSITSINGEIAGANISSCNSDNTSVDCNNDSSCTMGMKCVAAPSGNKFCRPVCSDAAPCADGFSCVNDSTYGKICLPFSSGSTSPSSTSNQTTSPSGSNPSTTTPLSSNQTTSPSSPSASSSTTTYLLFAFCVIFLFCLGITIYRKRRMNQNTSSVGNM